MAKGKQKHQARLDEIAFWGKDLARRAKRKCELCAGTDLLRTYDADPDVTPSLDSLALLCQRCRDVLQGSPADSRTLRYLETAIWNEEPILASMAKTMLAKVDADWAREALELIG